MRRVILGAWLLTLAACQSTSDKFPQRYTADEASYPVSSRSQILVVYVGAKNCPPCWHYKERDHPVWIETEEFAQVDYRELDFPRFQRTNEDRYWPQDLRWLRERTYAERGAPRWIVAVDGKVVANRKDWRGHTYPLIQRLVARKLGE